MKIGALHAAESQVSYAAGRWPAAKANKWYDAQPWPCGFNYIPAHAISYTEMWMPYNFDQAKMDKELALSEEIGFNCLRGSSVETCLPVRAKDGSTCYVGGTSNSTAVFRRIPIINDTQVADRKKNIFEVRSTHGRLG